MTNIIRSINRSRRSILLNIMRSQPLIVSVAKHETLQNSLLCQNNLNTVTI